MKIIALKNLVFFISLVLNLTLHENFLFRNANASNLQLYKIAPQLINDTNAILVWGTTTSANGKILYGTSSNYGLEKYSAHPSTYHSFQLTDLKPNTIYHYRISSKGAQGQYAESKDSTFRTADSQPKTPATFSHYTLFLDPNGNDTQDGKSVHTPIKSLAQAQKLLYLAKPESNVQININPGSYYDQRVDWTFTRSNYYLTITQTPGTKGVPVFDGCPQEGLTIPNAKCLGGTFFSLSGSTGSATNLIIKHLQIQNYGAGIALLGNSKRRNYGNSNNTIENCLFYNIGNNFNPKLPFGMYAVQLLNSKKNILKKNTFKNIINTHNEAWLHGIYISTYSSQNRVTDNRFENISGDPIRIRNNSNDNQISGNLFSKSGMFASISEWYCRKDEHEKCENSECPSWNNHVMNNSYSTSFSGKSISATTVFQSNTMNGCNIPNGDSTRITANNNFSHK